MKRKILIAVFFGIFLLGAFLSLTRGNQLDKSVGSVIVTNGEERFEVSGYKVSYNNGNKSRNVENPELKDVTDTLKTIGYGDGISVSYSDKFTDVSYSVYDENMKPIIQNESSLKISGSEGQKYYVEILVDWGSKSERVSEKYYFIIQY